MFEAIYIEMISQRPLRSTMGVARLLEAFEQDSKTLPSHWGPDERARNSYGREDLLASIATLDNEFSMPGLHRRKPPRYEAFFTARNSGLTSVTLTARSALKQSDAEAFFALGDRLAAALQVVYGFTHLVLNESSDAYASAGRLTSKELQQYGPRSIGTRTWIGPYIATLLGNAALSSLEVPHQENDWGGVRIDLVLQPWAADGAELDARLQTVMTQLAPSGVFGDYSQVLSYRAGPCWHPIPQEAAQ